MISTARGFARWMVTLGAAVSVWAAPAAAQDDSTLEGEARGLFVAGAAAYEGGRYAEALRHFQRAHELSGRPGLLYNIALSAERDRRDELALQSYEAYLEALPDAENRALVLRRIEFLRGQLAQDGPDEPDATEPAEVQAPDVEPEPRAAPDEPMPPPSPPPSEPDLAGPIALFAVAGAGLITFAITGGLTVAENDAVGDRCGADLPEPRCTDAELSDLATLAAVADVGWIVAAAAATAGAVWLAVALSSGGDSGERAVRVAPWATPRAGGFVVSGDMEGF